MNLGNRIADIRKKKKWTQNDLASKLFVADKTVSSWESNRTEPSLETIMRLSELFDCSISYLLYGNTRKSNIETEIKIKTTKFEYKKLQSFLENNAKFLNENKQIDKYYQPTHRRFLKDNEEIISEWLRIGLRGNKKILNYKNWHNNMYCDEYEVEIDDEKNLDKIFKILGLEEIAIVDKVRKTYFYLNKYEIALDYVENLGYFAEIEVKNYDTFALQEYDELLKLAKNLNLNLNNIDKKGYPYHFINKFNCMKNHTEMTDAEKNIE